MNRKKKAFKSSNLTHISLLSFDVINTINENNMGRLGFVSLSGNNSPLKEPRQELQAIITYLEAGAEGVMEEYGLLA